MSLCTDKFFYSAIAKSQAVQDATGGRIYNTADDSVENEEDTQVPYVIITNNGGQNQTESKDDVGESDTDTDNISIEIAATSREQLADIAKSVRKAVKAAFADFDDEDAVSFGFFLEDYTMSYGPVNFDEWKPCFWQTLNYQCETTAEE